MGNITFADVVHQSISFSSNDEADSLVLELIDNPWMQRLRDISQTANTRLVYMFSEHSRFGHCLGVAHLACSLLKSLEKQYDFVKEYKIAISVAALLHDIGHLAPGSHIAQKIWFPELPDQHEKIATRILQDDRTLKETINNHSPELLNQVISILLETESLPPWTWQIISGGGWNVDRGNWCMVDSILAGVSYGKYNIPAVTDSIVITESGHLGLRENRLDALMHFAVSRHAMYRQVYQHRVLLSADHISRALVKRAREIQSTLEFADPIMQELLKASSPDDVSLDSIFWIREAWWRYHLQHWADSSDEILSDLSKRLLNRNLFKTLRIRSIDDETELMKQARLATEQAGFDPDYYVHIASTMDVHTGDSKQSLKVVLDDGRERELVDSDPLFTALVNQEDTYRKSWIALPAEAKKLMNRTR